MPRTAVILCVLVLARVWAQAPKLDGSWRTRLEAWDWFDGSADSDYAFPGTIVRLGLSQQCARFDWRLEFAAPFLLGLPDNAIAPAPQGQLGLGAGYFAANHRERNVGMAFLKQGFLKFKGLGGNKSHSLRLGRFEFVDGAETVPKNATLAAIKRDRIAHRLLGHFGWTHVGRSLDGLHYTYDRPSTNSTLVAAQPTRGVFQADGWGRLDIAVVYGALTRPDKNAGEWRLFGIYYDDWRNVLKTDNRSVAARAADRDPIRMGTFGGHYLHAMTTGAGTLDLMFWGALQAGSWGTLGHRAGAVAGELGFQPKALPSLKPWLRGGITYTSGDGDAADNRHSTFFQVLPTPRWQCRFPFYNFMNMEDAFGAALLRPSKRLSLRWEYHSLRLASTKDFWYQGGGAFQPWTFGYIGRPSGGRHHLADLVDLSADVAVNPRLSIGLYFAHVIGGPVTSFVYPGGPGANLGYAEFTYRF